MIFLKTFGTLYFLDGVVGIVMGKGFLDFAIFLSEPGLVGLGLRIAANIPHIVIGGAAMVIGFWFASKMGIQASDKNETSA